MNTKTLTLLNLRKIFSSNELYVSHLHFRKKDRFNKKYSVFNSDKNQIKLGSTLTKDRQLSDMTLLFRID